MKKILYVYTAVLLVACVVLITYSPDTLSTIITAMMLAIVSLGLVFGIIKMFSVSSGLERGRKNIGVVNDVKAESEILLLQRLEKIFKQKTLDMLFERYKDKASLLYSTNKMLGDVDEYINEEVISTYCWNNVVSQIPGSLTGLGILGTFIGLIIGISEIGFSSVDAALNSVQTLLNGIHVAFYTSIAGVILSISFNVLYRIAWNTTVREADVFIDEFHKTVIPSVREQKLIKDNEIVTAVMEKLERIPKNPELSIGNTGTYIGTAETIMHNNEQVLMPQVTNGLKNGEFTFELQPTYDINTRQIIGAEAFVRWHHPTLGVLPPSAFLPVLEMNGYILKLDSYIWEKVVSFISKQIHQGTGMVPIAVNVSKTDILAGDVAQIFLDLIQKYQVPPRLIEVDMPKNAFTDTLVNTLEAVSKLREHGIKVSMDGFDGDFVAISAIGPSIVDELKLDLRPIEADIKKMEQAVLGAGQAGYSLGVVAIESMETVASLRKSGCTKGQGYYFSRPVPKELFVKMLAQEKIR